MTNHAHAEWRVSKLGDDLALTGTFDHLGSKREPVHYRVTHDEARQLTFKLAVGIGQLDPWSEDPIVEDVARAMWLADGFTLAFWDKSSGNRYRRRARIALDVLAHREGNAND